MSRRRLLVVQGSAAIVMLASLALAWRLSGNHVQFAAGQAALFAVFAVASLTLFGAMIMDFDKFVESVPPVPKRVLRRWFARVAERVGRLVVRGLARYRAVLTWLWVPTGRALIWTLDRYGAGLTWLWTGIGRASAWVLVASCRALTSLWSTTGRCTVRVLVRAGNGLNWLWARIVRAGSWAFAAYCRGLTWLWTRITRATVWALVSSGRVLTWLWSRIVRAAARVVARTDAGVARLPRTAAARDHRITRESLGRWCSRAVEMAFGLPPEDTSVVAAVGRRSARTPAEGGQRRTQIPATGVRSPGKGHGPRPGTRRAPASASARAPTRRREPPQAGRLRPRSDPDERLAAALARLRSAISHSDAHEHSGRESE